jgi:hypothetical protein
MFQFQEIEPEMILKYKTLNKNIMFVVCKTEVMPVIIQQLEPSQKAKVKVKQSLYRTG